VTLFVVEKRKEKKSKKIMNMIDVGVEKISSAFCDQKIVDENNKNIMKRVYNQLVNQDSISTAK